MTSGGGACMLAANRKVRCSMKPVKVKIADIYVPQALRVPVDAAKVEALALSIADQGQQEPIMVRADKERYVLVAGLHRVEAMKALGETIIIANLVQARKH
jgi:sulfiredoxin